MQIHELKRKTPNTRKVQVGRGGKRGKTSGRGHKGQNARAGRKLRPEIRDMIKKIPKKRGYGKNRSKSHNSGNIKSFGINISTLDKNFNAGDVVNVNSLLSKKLVTRVAGKKVTILGGGEVSKKVIINGLMVTDSAKIKIEKAGGIVK
jgi:large subunit ribosomal protein L15